MFLQPQNPNSRGGFVAIWPEDAQTWRPGPPAFDSFTNRCGDMTEGYDATSIPRLHPSVPRTQKLLHYPAHDGYPAFTVLLFKPKVQHASFIKDMHADASPWMRISQPPTLALFTYAEGSFYYPDEFQHAGWAVEDGVCVADFERLSQPLLAKLDPGEELSGALIIPHDDKWTDAFDNRAHLRPPPGDVNNIDDESSKMADLGRLLVHLGFWV